VLRDIVLDSSPGADWKEQIEIGVGRFTLALAKLGTAVAARYTDLPVEARVILNSAKGAEVSVYHLESGSMKGDFYKIIAQADKQMEKRGWYRVVGVIEERDLVAVYVRDDADLSRDAQVTVLVLNGRDMVCASARSDVRPLFRLAMEKAEEKLPPRT
jgi:hypothetical protein